MNIIHTYKINKLKKQLNLNEFQDVIVEINYTLKSFYEDQPGLADTETNRILTFTNFNIDSENFISYGDLSEEIVTSWVSEKSKELELHHEKVMNEYINPPEPQVIEETPPWE